MFFAQFNGGKRGRFSYLFDPQNRVPVSNFGINAGEKGIIFAHDPYIFSSDIWLAFFFAKQDYESRKATYSDMFNLVDIPKYSIAGTKDDVRTEFRVNQPVALLSFAVGGYEIHKDYAKLNSGLVLPLEFYSLPSGVGAVKEDFILAEMNNAVRYFSALFGDYPYPIFRGVYHPFGFGQGFPTTIMIPAADSASKYTYEFISHETSHQWWGISCFGVPTRTNGSAKALRIIAGRSIHNFETRPRPRKTLSNSLARN
jgi:hypothetical protein